MIVLVGPQSSAEQRGDLEELAGFLGAVTMHSPHVEWGEVASFVVSHDWEACPIAVADHDAACAFGLPVAYLKTEIR
ncbi:hypothetical protein [Streptomyces hydrogenans]|uniref:hypothetical protein n=1 Tax=Streptomyces hydrogenans TaxID=1873719 RepID=UPI0035D8F1A0